MSCTSKTITFDSDGNKLTGFLSHPVIKTLLPGVLFIHGGGKYTNNLYASWQEYLCQNKYTSFSFYCRGIGNSEGKFEEGSLSHRLVDALAAYKAFTASGMVDPNRICIYGSSMGAHIAVRMIKTYPMTKVLILQSAAAYTLKAEVLPLNDQFTEEIRNNGEFQEYPIFPILKQYEGATYVVYGEHDTVIPDRIKSLFHDSIRTGEHQLIKNGTHKLLRPKNQLERKARDELYSSTVHFLERYI